MGLAYSELVVAHTRKPELAGMVVAALGETGSLHLCFPKQVVLQLQLDELEKLGAVPTGGLKQMASYAGPIHLHFGNCNGFMGAIPTEDLDLAESPASRAIRVNSLNPNLNAPAAKGLGASHVEYDEMERK